MGDVTKCGDEVEVISDSESDEVETNMSLQPLEGATRVIWKFFGFDADKDGQILVSKKRKRTNVSCNRCNKKLKYTGGTSNFLINTTRASTSKPYALPRKNLVKHLVVLGALKTNK